MDVNCTVGAIVLGLHYNHQGGYFFEILLTEKHLLRPHCTPINMAEDVIEEYDKRNTSGCTKDLIFGDFNNKSSPSNYCDLINDYDDHALQLMLP